MDAASTPPDWRDETLGARVRVAAWLATVVGEGNSFPLEQLREAFQGSGDIGRRVRELRGAGWQIETFRGGAHGTEMRLIKIGDPVWNPSRREERRQLVSPRLRHEVLERDGYRCTDCGLMAGEGSTFLSAGPSVLEVHHIVPLSHGGTADKENLITLCASCDAGRSGRSGAEFDEVWEEVSELTLREQMVLLAWMAKDERTISPVERAWVMYRQSDPVQRRIVREELSDAIERTVADSTAE